MVLGFDSPIFSCSSYLQTPTLCLTQFLALIYFLNKCPVCFVLQKPLMMTVVMVPLTLWWKTQTNSLIGRGSCRVSLPIFVVSFYLPFDLDFDNAAKEGSSECSFNRYASLDDSHTEFRSSTATLYTLTETYNNRLGVDMAQSSAVSNPSNHR
jgi:hypothetical protein